MESLKRILLVDDNDISNYINQRLLKKAQIQAEVQIARNGQEAIDILKAVCPGAQYPELILLDINMPVMDGFEFLDELQKSIDLNSNSIKIILLSSSTHPLDVARAQQYPGIECIQKPLTPEKLAKFL